MWWQTNPWVCWQNISFWIQAPHPLCIYASQALDSRQAGQDATMQDCLSTHVQSKMHRGHGASHLDCDGTECIQSLNLM